MHANHNIVPKTRQDPLYYPILRQTFYLCQKCTTVHQCVEHLLHGGMSFQMSNGFFEKFGYTHVRTLCVVQAWKGQTTCLHFVVISSASTLLHRN
ncbi:MAG: hypothetical protein EBV05_14475 [Cyanobacteria bacterium WB6_1B_304]|nr:hypothetical protein [Cyanobacteria bacterium WB6_1B_304]